VAQRYATVRAVEVRVQTRASLQFQDVLLIIERPDACECHIKTTHEHIGASLDGIP
jgi:hypothetical protein